MNRKYSMFMIASICLVNEAIAKDDRSDGMTMWNRDCPMMSQMREHQHGGMAGQRQWQVPVTVIDEDRDGRISNTEAAAHAQNNFKRFDLNRDNILEESEFMYFGHPQRYDQRKRFFEKMDTNKDSKLTPEEFMSIHKDMYKKYDIDTDGYIDVWEFSSNGLGW